jgi:hypothetical protein
MFVTRVFDMHSVTNEYICTTPTHCVHARHMYICLFLMHLGMHAITYE